MRHISIIHFLFFLLFPAFLSAQAPEVKREREFTGPGLYGYMNGGAEQFLEYGVSHLITRDLVYKGEAFTIDIYDMPTSEDAFGIYSLHIFKCSRADAGGCIDCMSPYQLQAISGKQYISVVFPSGSEAARSKADEVIRLYVPMDGKEKPQIPDEMGITAPYSGHLKLLRGPISMSGASTSLSRLLKDTGYTGIWFTSGKRSEGYKAFICLKNKEEADKLKTKVPTSDILQSGDTFLYIQGKEAEEEEVHGEFGF